MANLLRFGIRDHPARVQERPMYQIVADRHRDRRNAPEHVVQAALTDENRLAMHHRVI